MSSAKLDLKQYFDQEEELFVDAYPSVIQLLTKEDYDRPDMQEVAKFFEKSLRYNVPEGKKRRAMFAILIFRYLKKDATERECKMARMGGWAIELLQGCFLVADDIVDRSITRRGQKCWSQVVRNSRHAMNDVFHLEAAAFQLLDIYFKDEDYYVQLVKNMRKFIYYTLAGQHLDLTYACPKEIDFTHFTMETYKRIVKYKTSYYTFYFPATMGLIMAGVKDQNVYDEALALLIKMGEYFQIQDDFLDCYGDREVIGKIGTDIQDNKCSWLIVTALDNCTEEQKKVLKDNYGRWDENCVKKVRDLYRSLDIEGHFRRYEEVEYQNLCKLIKAMDVSKHPVPIYKIFLDKLFQREK